MTTEQQKAAIEAKALAFGQKCDPLNQTLEKQADLRLGFLNGAKELIDHPERYGLQPVNQWISVKDRLPEEGDEYNVVIDIQDGLGDPVSSTIEWDAINKEWCYVGSDIRVDNVTHWQPLPHPPTDVEPK